MATEALRKEPLTLNFKEDTVTTVSRPMLRVMASKLGFNETQTVLYALARLRDEVMSSQGEGGFIALTKLQHEAISAAEPRRRGRVVDSLLP
jgi:K+ transporter